MSIEGADGKMHHAGGGFRLKLDGTYYVGLLVCSHSDTQTKTVDFSDVAITRPAALPPISATTKVESTLETVDVTSSDRAVVYHTADHIEAPNWTADGKTFIFNSQGRLFSMPVSGPVAGGAPIALDTGDLTHINNDHGPDYTPDGQWIYFNSVRSGNMKIWRMHPDGTQQEQVSTGDDSRDWFPHVSPDGKWVAYISFGTDVAPGDHPANRFVSIKVMPVSGGPARVVAKLFGGQGTMNVPSWSPDSTHLAFVSYRPVP